MFCQNAKPWANVPETLRDAFRKDIAQTVLLHFWGLIERELDVVSIARISKTALFQVTQRPR